MKIKKLKVPESILDVGQLKFFVNENNNVSMILSPEMHYWASINSKAITSYKLTYLHDDTVLFSSYSSIL